ncbi:MAG: RimK-like protein [Candidatus Melainabacteria bacterium]
MILILGSPEEVHARHVAEALAACGQAFAYADTRTFPQRALLSFEPTQQSSGFWQDVHTARRVDLSTVSAVYWRRWLGLDLPDLGDDHVNHMIYRDVESALGSWLRCQTHCRWVNPPEAIAMHQWKAYQLQVLSNAGIRVPDTLITNDPDALRAFYDRHAGRVIFKPVRGGAHTEAVTEADFSPDRLAALKQSPVQFQERIEGVDIRVMKIAETLFAGEIQAETLDFRGDPDAPVIPVALPAPVEKDCHRVADRLGLIWTGIDCRRTPAGDYVFFEANPSPMFIGFEALSGYPVTETLLRLLTDSPV